VKQDKIILFGNGSYYSIAVFDHLLKQGVTPIALVVPVYPPAATADKAAIRVDAPAANNQFIDIAERLSIPILYAPREAQVDLPGRLSMFDADYLLVACWPYLLSPGVIAAVNKAALNLHPSLLPEYRGPDPIAEQLACHETRFGVSLHRLNQQFDSGEIVRQASLDLGSGCPGPEQIETQAAITGAGLFIDFLNATRTIG
jgi:methionyl-tRNA formyltransferase